MTRSLRLVTLVGLSGLAAGRADAQLSLGDALRRADRGAYVNRIAAATADAEQARALAPLSGILPTLRLETGFMRTTDPLGAFGTSLGQRELTMASFDPARLNHPAPIDTWRSGAVAEVPLVNADAWLGRRAARRAAAASEARLTWTRRGTRVDVIEAYYGAVLSVEKVATLDAASRAAHAHVQQAQAMVREGLVTKSDALLASVRAGEVDAQLAEARGAASTARIALAVLLGDPNLAASTLPPTLPGSDAIRAVAVGDTSDLPMADRADVDAAEAGLEAARTDVRRARSTLLPRINAFGRYDWNDAGRAFGGDESWTVGVMSSWTVFGGAGEIADIRGANGRADAAQAGAEAARASAELERKQTRTLLMVALQRLAIAEQGAMQGAEAHRLVEKRYRGGLATVAELLDAQATETGSALALSHARYGVIAAVAERRQALGADPGTLAVLDDAVPAPTDAVATIPLTSPSR